MQHNVYQSVCKDDPVYDMPGDDSIEIDVCDKLLLKKKQWIVRI